MSDAHNIMEAVTEALQNGMEASEIVRHVGDALHEYAEDTFDPPEEIEDAASLLYTVVDELDAD